MVGNVEKGQIAKASDLDKQSGLFGGRREHNTSEMSSPTAVRPLAGTKTEQLLRHEPPKSSKSSVQSVPDSGNLHMTLPNHLASDFESRSLCTIGSSVGNSSIASVEADSGSCCSSDSSTQGSHGGFSHAKFESHLSRYYLTFLICIFALLSTIAFLVAPLVWHERAGSEKSCIYVAGGGFSGFWFTLGRMQSIDSPLSREYYCFSAGCLAIVATIKNATIDDVYSIAKDAQMQWSRSEISRYDVVPQFVDNLLNFSSGSGNVTRSNEDEFILALSNIKIITTVPSAKCGFRGSIRTPSNQFELRKMLLQTTWIPGAVGGAFMLEGHLDGLFSYLHHPRCDQQLGLPMDFGILANILNVNLSVERAKAFWQRGLSLGLK